MFHRRIAALRWLPTVLSPARAGTKKALPAGDADSRILHAFRCAQMPDCHVQLIRLTLKAFLLSRLTPLTHFRMTALREEPSLLLIKHLYHCELATDANENEIKTCCA